ncbi:MAG: thymidylate kinase [Spirochaetes bacterium DG_61]|jgi:dTMP kinase|nr:MAG: thymidylate kinase [Spirochaetes bacterium DG_61]
MADNTIPGTLIAVEGLDGSGKSTQIHLLHQWLLGLGCKVFFSEWNSSAIVKGATRKGKKKQLLTPTTFSLIHATDFADRYERQMLPMLKAGYIVLCDRYSFTAYARDGVRGCDPAWLRKLYGFAKVPDVIFYFRVPLNTALGRILGSRTNLKYFEAGMDLGLSPDIQESFRLFQQMVMEQYDKLAEEFRFVIIDATRPIPVQQEIIRSFISKKIDLAVYKQRVKR